MATNDGVPSNDGFALFLSEYAGEGEQRHHDHEEEENRTEEKEDEPEESRGDVRAEDEQQLPPEYSQSPEHSIDEHSE